MDESNSLIGIALLLNLFLLDADKMNYTNYYELCLKLIRKNGMIAFDNTLWSGRVLDER